MQAGLVESLSGVLPKVTKKQIDLKVLAMNDSKGFWSIASHCTSDLSAVIHRVVQETDVAHSSTSARPDYALERALCVVLSRLVHYGEVMEPTHSPKGYEKFLETLFPTDKFDVVLTVASVLSRHKTRNLATVVVGSMLGSNRRYLLSMPAFSDHWRSRVMTFAQRVLKLADQGRFERKVTDIMSCIEEAYRMVTRMKAFLSAVPFAAEHMRGDSLAEGLAMFSDIITPCLYHFTLSCDKLIQRRFQLQGIIAEIHNSALDAATIGLAFCFDTLKPEVIQEAESTLRELLSHTCNNTVSVALFRSSLSYRDWLRSIHEPPKKSYATLQDLLAAVATTLKKLDENVSPVFEHSMAEALLPHTQQRATGSAAPAWNSAAALTDPKVVQVSEMFPDWPVDFIKTALSEYSDDVEHLVNDALMGNLPPNLNDTLEVAKIAEATRAAVHGSSEIAPPPRPAAASDAPMPSALVEVAPKPQYEYFHDLRALEMAREGSQLWGSVGLDEGMKTTIRQLTELMYEDEYDDTADFGGPATVQMDNFGESEIKEPVQVPVPEPEPEEVVPEVRHGPAKKGSGAKPKFQSRSNRSNRPPR
eukprot:PhM_4_TR12788/c0_g1_i1/m.100818